MSRQILEMKAQAECFQWAWNELPETRMLLVSAINEHKDQKERAKRKAIGIVPGVSDMALYMPRSEYNGLFIELKTFAGNPSPAQKEWRRIIEGQGYLYQVCRVEPGNIENFKQLLTCYLNNTLTPC